MIVFGDDLGVEAPDPPFAIGDDGSGTRWRDASVPKHDRQNLHAFIIPVANK